MAYCVTFLTTALNKSIKEKEVPRSDFSTHQHVSNNDLDRTISIGPSDPEHDQSGFHIVKIVSVGELN